MSDIRKIEAYLEANGWRREVAGNADFDAALKAIKLADEEHKGLLISGVFGVGKTRLAEILARAFAPHWRYGFRKIELGDPNDVEKLSDEWQDAWCEDLHREVVLLDDVGAETATNDYGIITEPVAVFLTARHNRLMRYLSDGDLTELGDGKRRPFPMVFATTNLNAAEFDARYSGRISSRNKDLFIPLRLNGKDKRKWRKPAPATFDFPVFTNP